MSKLNMLEHCPTRSLPKSDNFLFSATMTRWRYLIIGLVLAFAPGLANAESALRVVIPAMPAQLDPHLAVTRTEHILARELFVGLTTLDAAGKVVAGLAENWTVSPEGDVYTFTLRDDLSWSDGQTLNATTIVKSFERALDPITAAPFFAQLLTIKNAEGFRLGTLGSGEKLGIVARDRRTVEFRLSAPSHRFLQVLAQPIAMPVPLHLMAKAKSEWATPGSLTGNGAYRLNKTADGYGLIKNSKFYAAPSVAIETIELRAMAERQSTISALQKGEADLVMGFTAEPHSGRPANKITIEGEGLDVYQLLINITHAPLSQRELRHALGMVIDRAEMIKVLQMGGAEPAFNVVPSPPYSPLRAPYAKLSRNDRRIVAEALLLDVNPAATAPLRFVYPAGSVHQAIAEFVAKAWMELGFKVDLTARDDAAFEQVVLAGEFDIAVSPCWQQAATVDAALNPFGQTAGPWNATRYRELSFDQFMTNADTETSAEFYMGQLRQAEGVLIEDQVSWPLVFYPTTVLTHTKWGGLVPNTAQTHLLRYLTPPAR